MLYNNMKSQVGTKTNRWLTRCGKIEFSQPELGEVLYLSFNWLKENVYLHRVIPTTLIYTEPTLFKLLQQMITLSRPTTLLFMKTSLLFENVSNDMLYKTSPSSSSKKPIYPHCVSHLLAFVPNCDFMLLDNISTLIVWRSKAMENRWWWWTTFGVRADDGFAENVFRGIARLMAERPACEHLFYKKKWKMAPPRFWCRPALPLTKNRGYASGDFGGQWCFETFW
jgi:hypothetical protein